MISGGEADVDVKVLAESGPDTRSELRAMVPTYILRESVETKELFQKHFCSFKCCREFTEGCEMACLGETIYYSEDGGMVPGIWEIGNEVYGNV